MIAAPSQPYALICETGSTTDVRLVPYTWFRGVCFSIFSDTAFATGSPERGVVETIIVSVLWLYVRRQEWFLCESLSSHVKLARDLK
jgi:hypothetical protein